MWLNPRSRCRVDQRELPEGGVAIALQIPTYSGGVTLYLTAERTEDGDWRVFLPAWPADADGLLRASNGIEVAAGIAYLGAPDVQVEAVGSFTQPFPPIGEGDFGW